MPAPILYGESYSIPRELGAVKDRFEGQAPISPEFPFLIYIQDAHANYAAQKNISGILEHLRKDLDMDLVFVEAAIGNLDAKYLQFASDPALNAKIVDRLARMGELTGSDLFLFEQGNRMEFAGMENAAFYREEIRSLKQVLGAQKKVKEWIRSHERLLDRELSHVAQKDLMTLLRMHLHADRDNAAWIKMISTLDRLSRNYLALNLRDARKQREYPNLVRLLRLKDEEGKIDVEKAKEEWGEIKSQVSGFKFQDLEKMFLDLEHEAGNMKPETHPRFLLEDLYARLKPRGFRFSKYPHFSAYARSRIFQYELNPKELFEEINRWLELLLNVLAQSGEERRMVAEVKDARLLYRFLKLELDRESWQQVKLRADHLAERASSLRDLYRSAFSFYQKAEEREKAFLGNIQRILKARKKDRAVVIAGGFHTDALTDAFRRHRWSYSIVSPALEGDSRENYVRTMLGRSSQDLLSSEAGSVPWTESPEDAARLDVEFSERLRLARSLGESMKQESRVPALTAAKQTANSLGEEDEGLTRREVLEIFAAAGAAAILGVPPAVLAQDGGGRTPRGPKRASPPEEVSREAIVRLESGHFKPGFGLDEASGAVPWAVNVRRDSRDGLIANVNHYNNPYDEALHIGFLLGLILEKRSLSSAVVEAGANERSRLGRTPVNRQNIVRYRLLNKLRTLSNFQTQNRYLEGFFPDLRINGDGTLERPDEYRDITSLGNGLLSWSLVTVISALERSRDSTDREIVALARQILGRQDYRVFYDRTRGLVFFKLRLDPGTGRLSWTDEYLQSMNQGILAVLYGVLQGQLPEDAWNNIRLTIVPYETESAGTIDAIQTSSGSMSELLALMFLPILRTRLAPLYQNFLFAQADFARRNGLPGFLASAQTERGFEWVGVPSLAVGRPARSDVAVAYATAMAALFEAPQDAVHAWMSNICNFPGMRTEKGYLESVSPTGYGSILTAAAKGTTLLSLSGGLVGEITAYLRNNRVSGSRTSMQEKLDQLLDAKFAQAMAALGRDTLNMPSGSFPLPNPRQITVTEPRPEEEPDSLMLFSLVNPERFEGRYVQVPGASSRLAEMTDQGVQLQRNVPRDAGTNLAYLNMPFSREVDVNAFQQIRLVLPADTPPQRFSLRFCTNTHVPLGHISVDTEQAELAPDGQSKIITLGMYQFPDAQVRRVNYLQLLCSDPRYERGPYSAHVRDARLHIRSIELRGIPRGTTRTRSTVPPVPGEFDLLRFANFNHGSLEVGYDTGEEVHTFQPVSGREEGANFIGTIVPEIDISGFRFFQVAVRNPSGRRGVQFGIDITHYPDGSLLGGIQTIPLPADDRWHVIQIPIAVRNPDRPVNNLYVYDVQGGPVELRGAAFSNERVSGRALGQGRRIRETRLGLALELTDGIFFQGDIDRVRILVPVPLQRTDKSLRRTTDFPSKVNPPKKLRTLLNRKSSKDSFLLKSA